MKKALKKTSTGPKNTVDPSEIAKFTAMADEWWSPTGKFKPLHKFNPVRIGYIRDAIADHFSRDATKPHVLKGISLLDIGCGGGLLSEPMARLGAEVVGVDAAEKNIAIASLHAEAQKLKIDYRCTTAESLAGRKKTFDVVLAMEIIEHVADVPAFLEACASLVKPGGLLFVATLNRTVKSYLFGIIGAEYVMGWLPKGTHTWQKFLKPSEIVMPLEKLGYKTKDIRGVQYHALKDSFSVSRDTSVNYMLVAERKR
ncbi:MAG: bifunctional 2-polyprenyl-6-hydroxyphenol methylase/3-demethylubiquinol 3-O-methyltransferase UbiG [Proteobacteria bacterium]|nr:bifunctional 2-polyprenyl-6-hydroxyphenol methylase/3-demethylubiquinol 3-O-methyltransferase UbiG [Pseudomonadota bacterium]